MAIDDSFKKPGAVPFKWEIRPGVPKTEEQPKQQQQQQPLQPPALPPLRQQNLLKPKPKPKHPPPALPRPASPFINPRSLPAPPQKLKPPPALSYFLPSPEPRTRSFRSAPRSRSERWRSDHQTTRVRPECVSPGCFPSPLLRRKEGKKTRSQKAGPDYTSDLETLSRWSLSVSSRRSLSSPFYGSPASSFSSYSYRSSPQPVGDAEWAGYGLF